MDKETPDGPPEGTSNESAGSLSESIPTPGGYGGIRQVGPDVPRSGDEEGISQAGGGSDTSQDDRASGEGDNPPNSRYSGATGAELPLQNKSTITKRDLTVALKAANGNFRLAAMALGCSATHLMQRVEDDSKLRAIYGYRLAISPVPELNETTTMKRRSSDLPASILEPSELAEALMRQDREMLRQGLLDVGLKQKTVDMLRKMDGFAVDAGSFLSASLDLTHRMHITAQGFILEQMMWIKEDVLADEKMDPFTKAQWMRCFNECADQLGRGYDRTLQGIQAMVSMRRGANADDEKNPQGGKTKPGWQVKTVGKS